MNDVTKKIIKEMMNYASTITFPVNAKSEIDGILDVVRYESISTFHVGNISYYYHPLRRLVELKPEYVYTKNQYQDLIGKILAKLKEVRNKVAVLPSELEREKYIHDFLCKNVTYKENGPDSHCVLGPLFRGEGVCEGIAKTAHALLKIAKIRTHIVCGDATDPNGSKTPHAWNVVQINGTWHLLDVTYDNTISDPDFIRYDYFNVSAKELSYSHAPYDYCREYYNRCVSSNTYFRMTRSELNTQQGVYDYIKQEVFKKSKNIYFKYTDRNRPLDIDALVNYTLEFPKVANVVYSYDKQMGVYYFKVKYGGLFSLFD